MFAISSPMRFGSCDIRRAAVPEAKAAAADVPPNAMPTKPLLGPHEPLMSFTPLGPPARVTMRWPPGAAASIQGPWPDPAHCELPHVPHRFGLIWQSRHLEPPIYSAPTA